MLVGLALLPNISCRLLCLLTAWLCAQADVHRDPKGTYWDTARAADAGLGYQPDSLWYRESHTGSVRAMVRGAW